MPDATTAIALPGCKSSSQRALMLAALADGESRIEGLSDCQDSTDLRAALQALGAAFAPDGAVPGSWRVRGSPPPHWGSAAEPGEAAVEVPVGEGASTLRFLLAAAAAGSGAVTLRPAPALAARPHGELLAILTRFGATIEAGLDAAGPRLRVRGRGGFGAQRVELGALQTSQTLSALWLAAGDAPMQWRLLQPAGSQGYLGLTAAMLRAVRGAESLIEREPGRAWDQAAGYGRDARLRVLADPSAALFFVVAALLLQRPVLLARPWNPQHADAALLQQLRDQEWLDWQEAAGGLRLLPGPSALRRALILDLDAAPDAGPALAVLAAHLPHGGQFTGLARLRIKESDRVLAMIRLAEACGADVALSADALRIAPGARSPQLGQPAAVRGARVAAAGDHRTAMAAGIASLLHPGLEPDDRACVAKSFPSFWEALAALQV